MPTTVPDPIKIIVFSQVRYRSEKQSGHLEEASSTGRATPRRPTLALIALAIALAMFAFSVWTALR